MRPLWVARRVSLKIHFDKFLGNKKEDGSYYWINQSEERWNPEHIWKMAIAEVGAILYGKGWRDPKCVDDKKQEQK